MIIVYLYLLVLVLVHDKELILSTISNEIAYKNYNERGWYIIHRKTPFLNNI